MDEEEKKNKHKAVTPEQIRDHARMYFAAKRESMLPVEANAEARFMKNVGSTVYRLIDDARVALMHHAAYRLPDEPRNQLEALGLDAEEMRYTWRKIFIEANTERLFLALLDTVLKDEEKMIYPPMPEIPEKKVE